jgi:phosphoribosylanthranilate isomerase
LTAARSGCDAIGLVFYEQSPRHVTAARAAEIVAALPPFVTTVGLFVDAPDRSVAEILDRVRLNLLQFHGDEPAEFCERFNRPYMKAVRVRAGTNLLQYATRYASASALLLDAYQDGVPGGTGRTFDWSLIPPQLTLPLVLAGGLNPDNVAEAIRMTRPYAVDVSGGVEREKGIKDAARIAAFMQGVSDASL